MEIGDIYHVDFSFTQKEVEAFAILTGDKNPLHLDEAYTANTTFKKPIIHGVLSMSVFSKILGMDFPGKGTVYMGHEIQFKRPMYTEEVYEAECEVLEIDKRRNTAHIKTNVSHKASKKITISGVAKVMNKEKI